MKASAADLWVFALRLQGPRMKSPQTENYQRFGDEEAPRPSGGAAPAPNGGFGLPPQSGVPTGPVMAAPPRGYYDPVSLTSPPGRQPQQQVYNLGSETPVYIQQPYAGTYQYLGGAPMAGPGQGAYPPGYGQPPVMVPVQALPVEVSVENTAFCSTSCMATCCGWFVVYIALIVGAAVVTAFLKVPGLLLLAVLPAVTLLVFLERRFRKSTIRMQMVITFFETALWMIPIVILENVVNYLLIVRTKLPSDGYCPKCLLSDFLQVREATKPVLASAVWSAFRGSLMPWCVRGVPSRPTLWRVCSRNR
jgi:hypothetical protein